MNLFDILKSSTITRDNYNRWTEYRIELTDIILENSVYGDRIAIYGAGCCNDIDIRRISDNGRHIILIDNSLEALESAVCFYNVKKNVELLIDDFVGISENDYRYFSDSIKEYIVKNSNSFIQEGLEIHVIELLDEIYRKAFSKNLKQLDDKYDIGVCAGVCSQINNMTMWIVDVYFKNLNLIPTKISGYIKATNDIAVKRFIKSVISSCTKEVIFLNEISRKGELGNIEGAIQAIEYVEELAKRYKCYQDIIEWNYNEDANIIYNMRLQRMIL